MIKTIIKWLIHNKSFQIKYNRFQKEGEEEKLKEKKLIINHYKINKYKKGSTN